MSSPVIKRQLFRPCHKLLVKAAYTWMWEFACMYLKVYGVETILMYLFHRQMIQSLFFYPCLQKQLHNCQKTMATTRWNVYTFMLFYACLQKQLHNCQKPWQQLDETYTHVVLLVFILSHKTLWLSLMLST